MFPTKIGLEIRKTHNQISRTMHKHALNNIDKKISVIQVKSMESIYIKMLQGEESFQKDLEKELDIKRSAVSLMLTNMEKNELIQRVSSKKDSRVNKIILTPKAIRLLEQTIIQCDKVEEQFLAGFTEDEKANLVIMLARIRRNLEKIGI